MSARVAPTARPRDAGFTALELAILAPFVLTMLMLVVGFGRVTHGRQLVDQAAAAAARAAALSGSPGAAAGRAEATAAETLAQAGVSCRTFGATVDVSSFRPGGRVAATVRCTAALSDLAIAGLPGSTELTSTAQAPLESFRQFGPEVTT